MLVIKAEIWPQGDVEGRFEIARIGIINRDSRADAAIADYNVVTILGRDGKEKILEGVVLAHIRNHGWQQLTSQALFERGPDIFHPEYTQTVVGLLRKG